MPAAAAALLPTDDAGTRLVPLEDVIAAHLDEVFPGMTVLEASPFRVTRNEDLEVDAEAENLLHALERELSRRRFGAPVRLEVDDDVSDRVLDLLVRELEITDHEVYRVAAPLDLAGLWPLAEPDRPDLHYPGFVPETHPALRGAGRRHRPTSSPRCAPATCCCTTPTTRSRPACRRSSSRPPPTRACTRSSSRSTAPAASRPSSTPWSTPPGPGKQVLVVVEIKARFDEQANIRWARKLEQAGCHVVYGLVGLKTHCKLALVVRSEDDGRLRRYVHVGTGNYNPKTARVYEDLGLLTADPDVGADVADLFNHLSGYTRHRDYDTLLVAPDTLRPGPARPHRARGAAGRARASARASRSR